MKKTWFQRVSFISGLVSSALFGFILGHYFFPADEPAEYHETIDLIENETALSEGSDLTRQYISTRFRLHGQDPGGKRFDLQLYINSKQVGDGVFIQNSLLFVTYDGKDEENWYRTTSPTLEFQPAGYLKQFDIIPLNEFTSQKSYMFTLQLEEISLKTTIDIVTGDFLIRNKPEYIFYISPGKAEIQTEEYAFDVNGVVTHSYSNDYSLSMFFEGKENLISETHVLALWDDQENFYYIDITDVENTDLPYGSHKWITFKNMTSGFMKYSFEADLSVEMKRSRPSKWTVLIPELDNAEMELEAVGYNRPLRYQSGSVRGTIYDASGNRDLTGQFIYSRKEGTP